MYDGFYGCSSVWRVLFVQCAQVVCKPPYQLSLRRLVLLVVRLLVVLLLWR